MGAQGWGCGRGPEAFACARHPRVPAAESTNREGAGDQHLPPARSCVTSALCSMAELPLAPGVGWPQGSVLRRWPGRLSWRGVCGVRGTWRGLGLGWPPRPQSRGALGEP